jgi:outer membrane protein assembly factor BamD (BamD/ComL family)
MGKFIAALMLGFLLVFLGCSGKKAEELYETAQFEELQKNYPHAKQLYNEIVEKHPNSEAAKKASERLKALEARS